MKRRHPHKSKVLLVNITRLGDMLQATPTIAGVKMENPDAKITVLVEKQFESVCHAIPNIDEVMSIDLGMTVRSLAREGEGIIDGFEYVSELVEKLRSREFDYCLNMSSSAYTALLLKLVGVERNGGWTSDEEGYRVIESDWARLFASSVFHQNRQFNSINLVDIFRCSADVIQHPHQLLINVDSESSKYAEGLVRSANFSNQGPLIAIQAGASQAKRQWSPSKFIRTIKVLTEKYNARVVMVGSARERAIIDPIVAGVGSSNILNVAGRTTVPQLSAVLKMSDVLLTGDTGPMHISVAVGTPVVAMFLASAYGFETGPYSEGNIVLQPVIGCGPCNPNKPCAKPDCHDHLDPEVLAELTMMRAGEDFKALPVNMVDPRQAIVYRSYFDQFGFVDLAPLNDDSIDSLRDYRKAYRKLWLKDIGELAVTQSQESPKSSLLQEAKHWSGLEQVIQAAHSGAKLIDQLVTLVRDERAPGSALKEVSTRITELDRHIEQIGFHYAPLGPLTRMFCFSKENINGSDALALASQMKGVYQDLARRGEQLARFYI